MSDEQKHLYNLLHEGQNKYCYFLLAISASAIGFTIKSVDNRIFELNLLPLGIGIFFWGLSFYYGCKYLMLKSNIIRANSEYLNFPKHTAESRALNEILIENSEKIGFYGSKQFYFLVTGGIFYIIWKLLEMFLRTY